MLVVVMVVAMVTERFLAVVIIEFGGSELWS